MWKNITEFLRDELQRRKDENPQYSLRAFARSLDIESSYLSKVLRGQRPVTWSLFDKIKDKFDLHPTEIRKLEETLGHEAEKGYNLIEEDAVSSVRGWQDIAVCAFGLLNDAGFSRESVVNYFKMTPAEAKDSLDRLVKIGLLDCDLTGQYSTSKSKVTTVGVPTRENLKKIQEDFLKKSIHTLHTVDESLRDHSGMTFPVSEADMPALKQKMKKFRREIVDWSKASGEKKEVYHMSISLFPMKG